MSSYDIWLFFLNIVENAQNNTNFWFFCVTRKYRYRGDTQDVVWRRSIRFWESQRSYFSSLKPLKWPSDPWVTFGQHLLPKIWLKNGWKSPFSTFLKVRGVLRDEFLWSHFFTSEKYDIRAFQNRAECPHTTSGYFFSISWKMHKTTRFFFA